MEQRIKDLENTLVKIESMCNWVEKDIRERDKVLCNIQSIRLEIARVYPKYMREVINNE